MRELRGALFESVDRETLLLATMYEYFVGNTDWSLAALHNMRIAAHPSGVFYPLIYDFDFSGLVNAHYTSVDPRMGVRTVRERVFRGPCPSEAEAQALAKHFLDKQPAMLEAINTVPGLSVRDKEGATSYVEEFFAIARDAKKTKRELVDRCVPRIGA